jgi:hypothetical protein
MNKSFYKDILDFEKQKAILEDLEKNRPKKSNVLEAKIIKPNNQKLNPKNNKKK